MKPFFVKTTSFLLAFFVLLSTFSFTVEKHYCGDFLIDISYLGNANSCGMQMQTKAVSKKNNCCKDEVQKIEGQDKLQKHSAEKFNFTKKQFLTTFLISYQNLFLQKSLKKNFYKDYSPPDLPNNYKVLYQAFLI